MARVNLDRVLVVDKPTGMTSFDVIRRLRRVLQIRKMGHTGTLDPDASGVLVVCIGWATKAVPYLTAADKSYVAQVTLGVETDTHDAEGAIVETKSVPSLDAAELDGHLDQFRGEIMQQPPRFSAIHVDGQRAYALARQGKEVVLDARQVRVDDLRCTRFELPTLELSCTVSKGTYIRSLARDLGRSIGCGAHLSGLRRTRAGAMTLERALTLTSIEEAADPIALVESVGLTITEALTDLQTVDLDAENSWRFVNGLPRILDGATTEGPAVVRRQSDELFLGLGYVEPLDGHIQVRPRRVYVKLESPLKQDSPKGDA